MMKKIILNKTGFNMQKLIKLLLLGLLLFSTANIFAQFAGEDKKVAKLANNTQTVVIGAASNNPQDCYKWSGGIILSADNLPQVTVNPRDSVTVFTCTRVSEHGVEQDQVKVFLIDDIQIVSVTPKRKCWSKGEAISVSEFEIVTDPPGMSGDVRLGANSTPAIGSVSSEKVSNMTVNFEAFADGHVTDNASTEIVVVNKDITTNASISVDLKVLKDFLEGIKSKGKFIETYLKNSPLKVPCSYEDPSFSVGGGLNLFNECCHDKVQDSEKYRVEGSLSGGGISCDFPLPPPYGGIPCIAELGITIKVGISATLGFDLTVSECQTEICADLAVSGSLTVGFYGQIWSKDVFRGELTATGYLHFGGVQICYPSGFKVGSMCLEAKGNYSVKFIGMITVAAGEVTLLQKTCLIGQL